jgi:hypothetical protein
MESPNCAALAACCPALPAAVTKSCSLLASQAIDSECAQEVATLHADGHCPALDGGARIDGSATADATLADVRGVDAQADAAVACVLLGACCQSTSLPAGESATCNAFLASGEESECATLLTSLTQSGSCTSGGATSESCPDLQACCQSASFPASFQTACVGAVNAGIAADCATQLSAYQMTQLCVSDGGTTAPACGVLSTCCISTMFPGNSQSTCLGVARSNNGDQCESAYTGYVAVGYCD